MAREIKLHTDWTHGVDVLLAVQEYPNGNLQLSFQDADPEFRGAPYMCITKDLCELPSFYAAVKTVHENGGLAEFLVTNGLAKYTGKELVHENCVYPILRFAPRKLKELHPAGFARYMDFLRKCRRTKKGPLFDIIDEKTGLAVARLKAEDGEKALSMFAECVTESGTQFALLPREGTTLLTLLDGRSWFVRQVPARGKADG